MLHVSVIGEKMTGNRDKIRKNCYGIFVEEMEEIEGRVEGKNQGDKEPGLILASCEPSPSTFVSFVVMTERNVSKFCLMGYKKQTKCFSYIIYQQVITHGSSGMPLSHFFL